MAGRTERLLRLLVHLPDRRRRRQGRRRRLPLPPPKPGSAAASTVAVVVLAAAAETTAAASSRWPVAATRERTGRRANDRGGDARGNGARRAEMGGLRPTLSRDGASDQRPGSSGDLAAAVGATSRRLNTECRTQRQQEVMAELAAAASSGGGGSGSPGGWPMRPSSARRFTRVVRTAE